MEGKFFGYHSIGRGLGVAKLLVSSYDRLDDAANGEFAMRFYYGVFRIGRHQLIDSRGGSEILQRPLVIHAGEHDVAVLGAHRSVYYDHIAVEYAGLDHGIAGDLEQKGCIGVVYQIFVEREGVDQLLFGRGRKAGLDVPDERKAEPPFYGDEAAGIVLFYVPLLHEFRCEAEGGVFGVVSEDPAYLGIGWKTAIDPIEPAQRL